MVVPDIDFELKGYGLVEWMFVMLIDTFRMVFILPDSLFVFVVGAGSVLTGVIDKIRIFDKVHR